MRLALLTDRFRPDVGGLARAEERIAHGLAAAGDDVDVHAVSPASAPGSIRAEEARGLVVVRHGAHRREEDTRAGVFEELGRRHRLRAFDLLQGFFLVRSGFLAAYAGRYLGCPAVVSVRGNDLDRSVFDPGRAAAVLRALDLASVVTAVSADQAEAAWRLGDCSGSSPSPRRGSRPSSRRRWSAGPLPFS